MKYAIAFGAIAQLASAHYVFDTTVLNGQTSSRNEYIRATTRETDYNPTKFSSNPAEDIRDNATIDSEDGICNQGAFSSAGNTKVLEIAAGEELTVQLAHGATMEHPGPGLVYMSKAPGDDVVSYDGTGDWFKIFEEGICNTSGDLQNDAWCTWGRADMTATIPAGTPDGEYLVRFEHIGVHRSHVNQPEHYISCVQVKVTGGGNGTPGPTVGIPAVYSDTDDYANFGIYNGMKDFPMPGPAVWNGSGSSGSSGSSSESSSSSSDDTSSAAESSAPAESSAASTGSDSEQSGSSGQEQSGGFGQGEAQGNDQAAGFGQASANDQSGGFGQGAGNDQFSGFGQGGAPVAANEFDQNSNVARDDNDDCAVEYVYV